MSKIKQTTCSLFHVQDCNCLNNERIEIIKTMLSTFWSDCTDSICYVCKMFTRDAVDSDLSKVIIIKEIMKLNVFQNHDIF